MKSGRFRPCDQKVLSQCSPKPKCGSPKPKCSSPKPKCGSPKPKRGSLKCGSPKPRHGFPKPKHGSPKPKRGSPKPKGGSPKPKHVSSPVYVAVHDTTSVLILLFGFIYLLLFYLELQHLSASVSLFTTSFLIRFSMRNCSQFHEELFPVSSPKLSWHSSWPAECSRAIPNFSHLSFSFALCCHLLFVRRNLLPLEHHQHVLIKNCVLRVSAAAPAEHRQDWECHICSCSVLLWAPHPGAGNEGGVRENIV